MYIPIFELFFCGKTCLWDMHSDYGERVFFLLFFFGVGCNISLFEIFMGEN